MQKRKGLGNSGSLSKCSLKSVLLENSLSRETLNTEGKEHKNIAKWHHGATCLKVGYKKRWEILYSAFFFEQRKQS